ncbi:MAG TPA: DUF4124 domain-containing protein [Casimicrobiaceae bacterium]|nr:DUF4124 domain-containing protein [Casimicrobiaceae bacterium]
MNQSSDRAGRVRARWLSGAAALIGLAAFATAGAATYKWTDEDGKVHYSDKAPPETPQGATVLDKQGRAVKKIEAPLSPEAQKAKTDEEEKQKAASRAHDEQVRQDRALLQSYTSENEIDLARNRAVSTLEAQISSAQSFREALTRQQKALAARKQGYEGKPIPVELDRESVSVDEELSRQNILIRQRQEELAMVTEKYDTIKQRWRDILADKDRAAAAEQPAKAAGAIPAKAAAAPAKTGTKPVTTAGQGVTK